MDVRHIAKLASLPLKSRELKKYSSQLIRIIDYVSQLSRLDTTNTKPTYHVTGLSNITRQDKSAPGLPVSLSLSQTPKNHQNLFVVPSIIDYE